jgi:uncharacterized protein
VISEKLDSQIAKGAPQYKAGEAKDITFCVTQACNLRCRYCYIVGADNHKSLTKDQAKKNIDFIFDNPELFYENSVIWNFIGGEPLLEIELIDYMCDYLKIRMYEKRSDDWLSDHMFCFSTNGTLYHKPEVRKFINKNKDHLSIGFSIDGVKELHDKYRVYQDGRGSFEDVLKNVPLYVADFQHHPTTKATLSHDSLPYIFESIKFLSTLGLDIYMNTVFEDIWQDGDDDIYYDQLLQAADWLIETGKWRTQVVSLFDSALIGPRNNNNKNWCGSGKMLHIDINGKLFPCTRLAPYSMTYRKEGFSFGDIERGYDQNKLDAFLNLTKPDQSDMSCLSCDIDDGCAWCTGWNYDRYGSIFKRATFICKMHKARMKANRYYFNRLESLIKSESFENSLKENAPIWEALAKE